MLTWETRTVAEDHGPASGAIYPPDLPIAYRNPGQPFRELLCEIELRWNHECALLINVTVSIGDSHTRHPFGEMARPGRYHRVALFVGLEARRDHYLSFLINKSVLPVNYHPGQTFREFIGKRILPLDNQLARMVDISAVGFQRVPTNSSQPFVKIFQAKLVKRDHFLAARVNVASELFAPHYRHPVAEVARVPPARRDDDFSGGVNVTRFSIRVIRRVTFIFLHVKSR